MITRQLLDKAQRRGTVDLIEAYALPLPLTMHPRDDLTSRLLLARFEEHAELSEEEIVAMLFLLLR